MTTSGWGVVNPVLYLIATTLQKGDMKIMDITECRRRWGRFGVVINDDMLCVSDSQTPVSCNVSTSLKISLLNPHHKY